MSKQLTIKEKIQILLKNRKPITFMTATILVVVLYIAYIALEVIF